MILNSTLASGLGRPDLAFMATGPTQQIGTPSGVSSVNAYVDSAPVGSRGPTIALMILVGGLTAFVWWVHPHLA